MIASKWIGVSRTKVARYASNVEGKTHISENNAGKYLAALRGEEYDETRLNSTIDLILAKLPRFVCVDETQDGQEVPAHMMSALAYSLEDLRAAAQNA